MKNLQDWIEDIHLKIHNTNNFDILNQLILHNTIELKKIELEYLNKNNFKCNKEPDINIL